MKQIALSKKFPIPENLVTDRFRLTKLTEKYAQLDYEAVTASIEHLLKCFPHWPKELSFEEDLISIIQTPSFLD